MRVLPHISPENYRPEPILSYSPQTADSVQYDIWLALQSWIWFLAVSALWYWKEESISKLLEVWNCSRINGGEKFHLWALSCPFIFWVKTLLPRCWHHYISKFLRTGHVYEGKYIAGSNRNAGERKSDKFESDTSTVEIKSSWSNWDRQKSNL